MLSSVTPAYPMIVLRTVCPEDEETVRTAHAALEYQDGFDFALGLEPGMGWEHYLELLDDNRNGRNLREGVVPSSFFLAFFEEKLVGRTSIRHRLNPKLIRRGGHIGFAVLPECRRQGFGHAIMRETLVIARERGIQPILVTCDDNNYGSRSIIESCGGVLDSIELTVGGSPCRRYWIFD